MNDDQQAVIQALANATRQGEAVALATVVGTRGSIPRHPGSKMLVFPDARTVGTVGGGAMEAQVINLALRCLDDGQSRLETFTLNSLADGDPGICGGSAQIFIEPLLAAPHLLVIGAGHVGVELAALGKWLGYRVTLTDDRADLCRPERVPDLDEYVVCPPAEIPQRVTIHRHTYVAAVTRGLAVDSAWLPPLLATDAPYIGLIGSKRRWQITLKTLHEAGTVDAAAVARVRSPIGLEIEAETPREIAISIMAEVIMVRRGGDGLPMYLATPADDDNQET